MDTWAECRCSSCNSVVVQNLKRNGYSSNALDPQALQDSVLPPAWYDRDKYLRGQEFFRINFLSIFVSNLVGLVSILHVHGIISVLMKTGKSSTVSTAARRYLSTLRHVYTWYTGDCFLPGSMANKSIRLVKKFHFSALISREKSENQDPSELNKDYQYLPSTSDCRGNENFSKDHRTVNSLAHTSDIFYDCQRVPQTSNSNAANLLQLGSASSGCTQQASQVDMVATLWAFCALPCICWRELGVAESSLPLVPDFLHFWRTVGYLMGVRDCFNICGPAEERCGKEGDSHGSVSSTTPANDHFRALLHQLLVPAVAENKIHSRQMADALLRGVQKLLRVVEPVAFSCFAHRLLGLAPEVQLPLTLYQRCVLWLQTYVLGTVLHVPLVGRCVRLALNGLLLFAITYADNAYVIAAVNCFLAAFRLPLQLCFRTFSWLQDAAKLVQQKLVFL